MNRLNHLSESNNRLTLIAMILGLGLGMGLVIFLSKRQNDSLGALSEGKGFIEARQTKQSVQTGYFHTSPGLKPGDPSANTHPLYRDQLQGTKQVLVVNRRDHYHPYSSNRFNAISENISQNNDRYLTRTVEFWSSPGNLKAYKLINYRLLIFGIDISEELILFKARDQYYLEYKSHLYPLERSPIFLPLLPLEVPGLKNNTNNHEP